jgi:hypothetical protein
MGYRHDYKRAQRQGKTTTVTHQSMKRQESPLIYDGEYINYETLFLSDRLNVFSRNTIEHELNIQGG